MEANCAMLSGTRGESIVRIMHSAFNVHNCFIVLDTSAACVFVFASFEFHFAHFMTYVQVQMYYRFTKASGEMAHQAAGIFWND
jgi:hypothetical protein